MSEEHEFSAKIEQFRRQVQEMPNDASPEIIEKTAVRLEGINYAPPVIIEHARFLRLTKQELLDEIDRIVAMPDAEACALAPNEPKKCRDLRVEFISVQMFYYRKLAFLRQGDIETWDEIDELYVHD
jgi:protein-tyrosine-phosphatase